jgi:hypothetical protein
LVSVVPTLRLVAVLLAAITVSSACGSAASTTTDPRTIAAQDYAFSARRALDGTRFAELGDPWLVDLLLGVCDDLTAGVNPDSRIAAAATDAASNRPGDDGILTVVIGEGIDALCPGAAGSAAGNVVADYLALAQEAAAQLGIDMTDDRLLQGGTAMCLVIEAGGTADEAIIAELEALFGISGSTVSEISESGALGEAEGLLAGSVLGAAAGLLCPEHRAVVDAYLGLLGE